MSLYSDLALLAPVPVQHLQSGVEVCQREGKVAFASAAFEFFLELDAKRAERPIPVYFYASQEEVMKPVISWQGIYTGFYHSDNGFDPNKNRFRPPTTYQGQSPDSDDWPLFWEVENLTEIPEGPGRLPLYNLVAYKGKKKLALNFLPQGPVLIRNL